VRRVVIPPEFPPGDAAAWIPQPERSLGSGARVWLVRHAEVHADWQRRAYGNLDIPLSAHGEEETRALGAAFRGEHIARVTSSSLQRALAMGRAFASSTGAELAVDERLREIFRGDWQGMPADEFRRRWEADRDAFFADPWHWKAHGGESDADVFDRAWKALGDALAKSPGAEIAITTHYNVIRVIVTRALGLSPQESFAFRHDPAHAALLVDGEDGWRLAARNVDRPDGASLAAPGDRRPEQSDEASPERARAIPDQRKSPT
jgi:broad specificity phosphatase PhoE